MAYWKSVKEKPRPHQEHTNFSVMVLLKNKENHIYLGYYCFALNIWYANNISIANPTDPIEWSYFELKE